MSPTKLAELQASPCPGSEGRVCKRGSERQTESGEALPPRRVPSAAPRGAPLHVARLTEEAVVQRVAALVRGLHGQEDPAVLWETRHERMDPRPEQAAQSLRGADPAPPRAFADEIN